MRVKYFTSAVTAAALSTCAIVSHADNGNDNNHNWMPKQPDNMYWQAPNFSFPPTHNTAPPAYKPPPTPPARENSYQQPPTAQRPPPAYRPPQRPVYNNYPAPNMNNRGGDNRRQYYNSGNQGNMNRPAPNANMNQNSNRNYPQPPRGSYGPGYRPDNGASAYSTPGYNRNRNNNGWGNNNGWNNNKFWGQSGPSQWMNPNKNNMEQGWDDMINAPSRMGEMPGGWTAPELSMPNPVDMGDQMQDNMKDLPEQIRNMDVGN